MSCILHCETVFFIGKEKLRIGNGHRIGSFFDLQQDQHHTDPGKDMSDACDPGDGSVHPFTERCAPNLCQSSHEKAECGNIDTDVVAENLFGKIFPGRKGKVFLKKHQ